MSKKLLYYLGILLTIIVGTILCRYYSCDCRARSGDKRVAKTDSSIVAMPEKFTVVEQAASDSAHAKSMLEARLKLNANPLVLYYGINQSQINLNQEEKRKLTEIVDYLKNVPDAGLIITGHADNTGNRDSNIRLGKERADHLKALLIQSGITEDKITCASRGQDEPAADNSTSEGRAKNRRTVTLIK